MTLFPDILKTPDSITLELENEEFYVFFNTDTAAVDDVVLSVNNGKVTLKAENTPVEEIVLRWNFNMPENTVFCGDHWERGYGDLEWRGYAPDRVMPWFFYAVCGNKFSGFGVKVKPDAFCHFKADKGGISLFINVRSGRRACVLNGKEINCCETVCAEYENVNLFENEQKFVALMCDCGVFPKNPIYGFNNWYYAYGNSSHEKILENTKHLASLTTGLKNRPYMVIDDCWQLHRKDSDGYIGGPWRAGNVEFPDMKRLAEEIAAYDVLPGIWCRPTQNKDENIPDNWYRYKEDYYLDISVPGVLEYIAKDIDTICNWGYKLIKYDFSTFDLTGKWGPEMNSGVCNDDVEFFDRSKTTAMLIKELYKTVFEASNGRALILGCNTVGHLGAGFMEIARTGNDTSGREWTPTRQNGVNTLAFRMPVHNNFYFVDADCAGLTKSVEWEKNRQWLELLAKSGTPLFVSVAPTTLDSEQNEFLREMLKYASEEHTVAVPLDIMNDMCPEDWLIDGKIKHFDWY